MSWDGCGVTLSYFQHSWTNCLDARKIWFYESTSSFTEQNFCEVPADARKKIQVHIARCNWLKKTLCVLFNIYSELCVLFNMYSELCVLFNIYSELCVLFDIYSVLFNIFRVLTWSAGAVSGQSVN